ncbi:MAG: glutamine--tRNA ligase/YqeY domain fusion protein [bacterium]|nr:glutamine--tRNA ligase/YqeY domain fusion protein [Planctomycetota bacterium]HIL52920.1 glutamine--tRNA ligase/YqeY domain fusion protein [Planctomycetota bacterium]
MAEDKTSEGDHPGEQPRDFIRSRVAEDVAAGKHGGEVHTRFPPEPNGFLHIGHAKAITINFSIAAEFGGVCNLRFDDTNPAREDPKYAAAIEEDLAWLGFSWGDNLFHASDYFEQLYQYALQLVEKGLAYVDDLSAEETREYRGTVNAAGRKSPFRERSVEENLDLFRRMRAGEFSDGARTLRAKIDMASPNMNLRDPAIYRIRKVTHQRSGDEWPIYPMYDFAHGLSDSIEGITHSLCSLEFENHRPLYDWFLDKLGVFHPQQIEFARLNLSFTVLSKRYLTQLVDEGLVDGWDDPRMPTLAGLRRRGYTPEAVRSFLAGIGVAKFNSTVELVLLENALRVELNKTAPRRMAVLDPLKVVIDNWPAGEVDFLTAINNPEDESAGTRTVPFSGELYIEQGDFKADPPKKFWRLAPGNEVRLRYAFYIKCTSFETDPETGDVTLVHATYDPETRGGDSPDGRKIKATLHWVSAEHSFEADVRNFDHLFQTPNPMAGDDKTKFKELLNPDSLGLKTGCKLEPGLAEAQPGERYQFERLGYYCVDTRLSAPQAPVFNRAVALRDSWAKVQARG